MERLEDAGLLLGQESENNKSPQPFADAAGQVANLGQGRVLQGTPWFDEMIQGSELGRIKRRRGGGTSSDGKTKVEWEITEFDSGEGDAPVASTGKRKLGSLDAGNDVEMRSA